MASSNLTVRLATAAVAIPLLVGGIFFSPPEVWLGLVTLSAAIAGVELSGLCASEHPSAKWLSGLSSAALVLAIHGDRIGISPPGRPSLLLTVGTIVVIVGMLYALRNAQPIESAARRLLAGIAVPMYAGLLTAPIAQVRFETQGSFWVLLFLSLAWMGDTGGYVGGRLFGKHPLSPIISPKKTIEGFIGSMAGSAIAGVAGGFYLSALNPIEGGIIGAFCGAIGQFGDLAESLMKRSVGVKDSGQLIPGHGGILDRIDALLVVAPLVYLYASWMGRF